MTKLALLGLGATNSLGFSAAAIHAAVRAAIANFEEHPSVLTRQGDPIVVARSAACGWDTPIRDRLQQLATAALQDLARSALSRWSTPLPALSVSCALPSARPGLTEADIQATRLAIVQKIADWAPVEDCQFFDSGHAGTLVALSKLDPSRHSHRIWLVGGVDSYLAPETLRWLDSEGRVHKPTNAWGFVPGEGACFGIFCSPQTAHDLALRPIYQIDAVGIATEPNPAGSGRICLGRGLTDAVRMALAGLPPRTKIQRVCIDLNGEAHRSDDLGFTLTRINRELSDRWDLTAPADCWGDVGAASGMSLLLRHGLDVPVTSEDAHHLILCSAATAERSAALARVPEERLAWQ